MRYPGKLRLHQYTALPSYPSDSSSSNHYTSSSNPPASSSPSNERASFSGENDATLDPRCNKADKDIEITSYGDGLEMDSTNASLQESLPLQPLTLRSSLDSTSPSPQHTLGSHLDKQDHSLSSRRGIASSSELSRLHPFCEDVQQSSDSTRVGGQGDSRASRERVAILHSQEQMAPAYIGSQEQGADLEASGGSEAARTESSRNRRLCHPNFTIFFSDIIHEWAVHHAVEAVLVTLALFFTVYTFHIHEKNFWSMPSMWRDFIPCWWFSIIFVKFLSASRVPLRGRARTDDVCNQIARACATVGAGIIAASLLKIATLWNADNAHFPSVISPPPSLTTVTIFLPQPTSTRTPIFTQW